VGYTLGVDVGTTFTAAAVEREGVTEVQTLGTTSMAMPTVVALADDGSFLIGEPAVRRGITEPQRIAREFKRRLGDPSEIRPTW